MAAKVNFINTAEVTEGENLLEIAKDFDIKLKHSCHGKGKCGKCVVKVISGNLTKPTDKEVKALGAAKIDEGYRLACQADVIEGEVTIEVINYKDL